MVGATRLFIGGLPISNELDKSDLLKVVGKYAKDIEIIRDSEGYCKGFAYINVAPNVAHACISDLAGKPFQKGLLRVEQATEPFMDKLRREWGEAALNVQYTFPSTPTYSSTSSSTSSSTPVTPTPFTLDTSSVAATPAKKVTKLGNPEPTTPTTPAGANKTKKELKLQAYKEKERAKLLAKKAAAKGITTDESTTTPKRKAEDLEEESEAPVPAEVAPPVQPTPAPKKAAPQPKQVASLNLGDDDETPAPVTTPAKKVKTENNKNDNKNNNNNNNKKENKNENNNKNNNNNNNNNNKKNTPTPAPKTPTPAPAPVVPSTPVTPGASGIAAWDLDTVHSWATGVAGDEVADKLKTKGVKGRKLANWRDSFSGNANGLRKQISEFLQLPESLEADADDLSEAILRLA